MGISALSFIADVAQTIAAGARRRARRMRLHRMIRNSERLGLYDFEEFQLPE